MCLCAGGSAQAAMTIFGDFFGTCDPHEASRSKPRLQHGVARACHMA